MVAGREGDIEKFGAGDFAGGEAAEEISLKQIFFATMTGDGDPAC